MSRRKPAAWSALVGTLIVLAYVGNAAGPDPADDLLYRYSTAAAVLVQYAIISAIVFLISRGLARETLGLRRRASWRRAGALTLASLLGIWAASWVLSLFLDAGEEQGLVPDSWDPSALDPSSRTSS